MYRCLYICVCVCMYSNAQIYRYSIHIYMCLKYLGHHEASEEILVPALLKITFLELNCYSSASVTHFD